ncbi:unnamed protein product [marine sediment metagenome]|uniref:Uncharacterized protein n=1 Tax=marine sediment metagenome TaxID=412755 RepID=X0UCP8_9ZZZZ
MNIILGLILVLICLGMHPIFIYLKKIYPERVSTFWLHYPVGGSAVIILMMLWSVI